jgi:hypothetical protein
MKGGGFVAKTQTTYKYLAPGAKEVSMTGAVHAHTLEGFWSHVKRGVSGVFYPF